MDGHDRTGARGGSRDPGSRRRSNASHGTSRTRPPPTAQRAHPADRYQAHQGTPRPGWPGAAGAEHGRCRRPGPDGGRAARTQRTCHLGGGRWKLNVWTQDQQGQPGRLTVVPAGDKVQVTGHRPRAVGAGCTAVTAWAGCTRPTWPTAEPAAGITVSGPRLGGTGPDGSAVESGLRTHTSRSTERSVRRSRTSPPGAAARAAGDHGSGLALDIMCTGSLGDAIAAYVRAHATSWRQLCDLVAAHLDGQRASEGWRTMPDRGHNGQPLRPRARLRLLRLAPQVDRRPHPPGVGDQLRQPVDVDLLQPEHDQRPAVVARRA